MSVGATPDYEAAYLHDSELSARQRDVLKLIAAGKTNGEIGETLKMTLDGAKWNVSEVLTKLGLSSREEAAAYWHWRQSPSRRLHGSVRALFASTIGRIALGGAVLAAGGVAVAGLALQGSDAPEKSQATPPFYLEATVNVQPGPDDRSGDRASTSNIQWNYQDERHFRQSINNESPSLDSTSMIVVGDGRELWFYDTSENSYSRVPFPSGGAPASRLMMSVWMGPVPASDIDAFVLLLKSSVRDGTVEVVGSDQVLGRKVQVIETKSVTGESVLRSSDGTETTTFGPLQTTRLWFDPETRMVLRYLRLPAGDRQGIQMEVTRLDFGQRVAAGTFVFEPPPGSTNRSGTGTRSSSGGGSPVLGSAGRIPPLPKPFVSASYLPARFKFGGQGETSGDGGLIAAEDRWRSDSGDTLTLQQRLRADGLPKGLQVGDRIRVSNHDAFRRETYASTTIAWYHEGLAVLITAVGMDDDELMRFAQGLHVAQ